MDPSQAGFVREIDQALAAGRLTIWVGGAPITFKSPEQLHRARAEVLKPAPQFRIQRTWQVKPPVAGASR